MLGTEIFWSLPEDQIVKVHDPIIGIINFMEEIKLISRFIKFTFGFILGYSSYARAVEFLYVRQHVEESVDDKL
jgi:hypothetical protein